MLQLGESTALQVETLEQLKVVMEKEELQWKPLEVNDLKAVGQDATVEEVSKLMQLVYKYRKCFSLKIQEMGFTQIAQMELNEADGSRSVVR